MNFATEDKYILGSMIILIGICFWHAASGSIVFNSYPYLSQKITETPTPTTTLALTTVTTTSFGHLLDYNDTKTESKPNTCTTAKPCSTAKKPGLDAVRVDKLAMLAFACVYGSFNMFFLIKVFMGYRQTLQERYKANSNNLVSFEAFIFKITFEKVVFTKQ
ncbi:hypothetical protein HELRODRAFT_161280 [Helobdella robusta]|uniref:Uncharacterized protein n=1 Tax=Helobdella robusta TaxID=6412 RepID=T1ERA2_HELRO|nr:hypothetical protein HELRODRAFT_161280 [Helobdella robusta]ESO02052.1 hypothetical protein HELRODRAFT_161280 [Helobdella robusta]